MADLRKDIYTDRAYISIYIYSYEIYDVCIWAYLYIYVYSYDINVRNGMYMYV